MVKRLTPIDNGEVHLAVIECNCGYHMTWDASWLLYRDDENDKWPLTQHCPACGAVVSYHVDDEVTIETREEIRAAADAVMEKHAPPRYKTAKLIKEYEFRFHGETVTVPVSTVVTNKTACGFDDNYRFAEPWKGMPPGFASSYEMKHVGVNVPAEYCEPYPENNYVRG